jgi:hypothetical protein
MSYQSNTIIIMYLINGMHLATSRHLNLCVCVCVCVQVHMCYLNMLGTE